MAAGWLNELAGDRIEIRSAGTEPKEQINPIAIQAMAEVGIDIANNQPKVLTDEAVLASDYVITMGCGDKCPFFPGKTYRDWVLADPAGQDIEMVRRVRDEIRDHVTALIAEIDAK
ncbi:MAG: Arsenate-mycothiol transferase ArsC2 [Actinomycetota bacterium]|jgi:protein-tyrosine-phosphatase